ncbi:MAG: hypothetical protein QOK48_2130 [Blastocatellia bacterium]|jgi:hypothetical protein|nr:hypothetical protein [Blastocatellia bacterium]
MTSKTRTQITIQTRQTIIVRPISESFRAWCDQCLEVVAALTCESVTGLLQVPISNVLDLLASGQLHAVEVGGPSPLVCGNSLAANPTETQIQIEGERK